MKKNKILLGFLVLAIAIAGIYFWFNKEEVLEVHTMKSYRGSIVKEVELLGTINSDNIEIITLPSNVKAINIYVEENDLIEENKLLAELDPEDLLLSLEKEKLNLQQVKSDLNNLSNDLSNAALLENDVLKREEELAILSRDLIKANEDLQRAQALYNKGAISQVEHNDYLIAIDNLNSQIMTAELNLNDAITKNISNNDKKQEDILTLQRQIEAVNLEIKNLNSKIKDSKIYSSISGYVTEFPLELSKKTINEDKIVIHGADSYEFVAKVPQKDALLIKEGQISQVKIEGLDTSYEGQVVFISKVANTDDSAGKTPKVEIKIKVVNPDQVIKFGYEGSAVINVDTVEDVIVIKNECVKNQDGKDYVFVVENNIVRKAYVERGLTDGYSTSILAGIDEGDLIVVNPPIDLIEGGKIKGDKK